MNHQSISKIQKSKRKGYYDVYVESEKITLSESIIVKYEILKDRIFTEEEIEKIKKENNEQKLFESVLNYISYQMRSEKEIYEYLLKKEAGLDYINKCIDSLKQMGYINDELFSKYLLEQVIRNKKGPIVLENKLKLKGINDSIIRKTILNYTDDIQVDVISSILDNINIDNKLPVKKQKRRLCEKFIHDGFPQTLAFKKVNEINFEFDGYEELRADVLKIRRTFENEKYQKYSKYELKNKLINKLLLKGYEYSDIKNILSEDKF